ncbi:hypothetical protein [Candidatus Solirubrobacter pratensis]|uniref:hypothetical protein n=1 Tax=Candidatus Solirubrobacter pratensis TaxID=1298857 RepID=UPI00040A983F|nr:hypothetical protein [Candidatus Solirubrobacter pratensis]
MEPKHADVRRDAVATAALIVIRRALVEGVPVTREGLVEAASITLGASQDDASQELDAVAQGFGVSALE